MLQTRIPVPMDYISKPNNKQLKEEFVSNLEGSSMLELASFSVIFPIITLLRHWSSSNWQGPCRRNNSHTLDPKPWKSYMVLLVKDFLLVVLPCLSVITILSDWNHICAIGLVFLVMICLLKRRYSSFASKVVGEVQSIVSSRSCLSSYRVTLIIVTCLSILAVDFKFFPRRYAKTEAYGTSLMDMGVGSFVMANALVSRQARGIAHMSWLDYVKSVSPLVFLGFGRLVLTAKVNYQVHVGEYGIHWNFFFTLAAVSLLSSFAGVDSKFCGILGISILGGYQICLLCGLNEYLLSSERVSIISQNKEGIFSIFGYWGLYLVCVYLGQQLFFKQSRTKQPCNVQCKIIQMWILSCLCWVIAVILDKYVERVSRRMCNLAYVVIVIAQNLQSLSILMLSDVVHGSHAFLLEKAFDRNLLSLFILANILTGVVNLLFDTMEVRLMTSFALLVLYSFVLCLAAVIFMLTDVKLKCS